MRDLSEPEINTNQTLHFSVKKKKKSSMSDLYSNSLDICSERNLGTATDGTEVFTNTNS